MSKINPKNSELEKISLKPIKKRAIISEAFVNICSNTTAHALPNIFRSDIIIIKIFWFILLLAGIGASAYYIYDSVFNYFQFPYTVNTNVYESTLEDFPAVSICNLNPFDASKSSVFEYLNDNLRKNGLIAQINVTDEAPAIYQVNKIKKLLKANFINDFTKNLSFIKNPPGFGIESMLISCYFNGEKCTKHNFYPFGTFDYGACFSFNYKLNSSAEIKQTGKTGPTSGLSMEIFTGFPGKQDFFNEKGGIYVVVHNNSKKPSVRFEGVKIPVGYSADIAINRKFYDRLGPPYSDCRKDTSNYTDDDPEYYKSTLKLGVYTKKNCFEMCLQYLFIIPRCNCSDPSVETIDKTQTICTTLENIECVDNVRKEFDSKDLSEYCDKQCPTECDKIEYSYDIRFSDYPTTYYFNVISSQSNLASKFNSFGQIDYNLFKQSVLMVNLFYQDLSYTILKESPKISVADVLGVVGGQVGLFLGCSVLTFMEPIEFLLEICFKLFKRSKQINISKI